MGKINATFWRTRLIVNNINKKEVERGHPKHGCSFGETCPKISMNQTYIFLCSMRWLNLFRHNFFSHHRQMNALQNCTLTVMAP